MITPPEILIVTAVATAVIPLTVSRAAIKDLMVPAIGEVLATLAAQSASPAGPCVAFHRRRPKDFFDFEVGFPVAAPIVPTGRVINSVLPAARVVQTVHQGDYDGLASAWGEFVDWIEAQDLKTQEHFWESYLTDPETTPDPADWQTQLTVPLAN